LEGDLEAHVDIGSALYQQGATLLATNPAQDSGNQRRRPVSSSHVDAAGISQLMDREMRRRTSRAADEEGEDISGYARQARDDAGATQGTRAANAQQLRFVEAACTGRKPRGRQKPSNAPLDRLY
jgi:hypothetical protein